MARRRGDRLLCVTSDRVRFRLRYTLRNVDSLFFLVIAAEFA